MLDLHGFRDITWQYFMFNDEMIFLLVAVVAVAVRAIILTVRGTSDRTSPILENSFRNSEPLKMEKVTLKNRSVLAIDYTILLALSTDTVTVNLSSLF